MKQHLARYSVCKLNTPYQSGVYYGVYDNSMTRGYVNELGEHVENTPVYYTVEDAQQVADKLNANC